MSDDFFLHPILNSPYEYPSRHWELDNTGQPTQNIVNERRRADFITPIPKPRKQSVNQAELDLGTAEHVSTSNQQYDMQAVINDVRRNVDEWRNLKNQSEWKVTPETARLLHHWRHHNFSGIRPFFCQIEAVETLIWLTEVAPASPKGKQFLDYLERANENANPKLFRIALKMATGAGKTTVMAMIIAWQTINSVRYKSSKRFTRGFLVVAPGLTIKDRLRVLQPSDPDSYYAKRELVPADLLPEISKAKIVITNYHIFKMREKIELAKGTRSLLQGRGEALETTETDGQMIQRAMAELMAIKNVMVINDEAHHCYREKPEPDTDSKLKGDERKEAEENNKAARLWINGLETVKKHLGLNRVIDLSATPFFLSGSGYVEGTLFPWTMSDFSLMDAIECGIVKLPRVPVADNIPGSEMPMFRNLWENIKSKMPKKGRGNSKILDPLSIPPELQTALKALYGHYEKTFKLWEQSGMSVPPCFIIVCNNTSTSKIIYDYVSGFQPAVLDDGTLPPIENGRLELFRNFTDEGQPLPRPRTLLIDSEQLESGDSLGTDFITAAADEIERFRREIFERGGRQADELRAGKELDDSAILREVMNTVGKPGTLGSDIRCVVSVSMLTEGWDANTVTHILGVRAFGTQLLCEQVIGRALRRQSYDLNEENKFNVEYADVLGIPFDFNAKPVVSTPIPPRQTVHVHAVRPERDHLEITFPRVQGYRVDLPNEVLHASFTNDSIFELTPDIVGPSITQNQGIIGEGVSLTLENLKEIRYSTILYNITERLLYTKWRDPHEQPKIHLFGQLKKIVKEWLDNYLVCKGDTYPGLLMYQQLCDHACERITAAITQAYVGEKPVKAVLNSYNPIGSTRNINFNTSKQNKWETIGLANGPRSHVNWIILDSDWEGEFCRIAESHPRVVSYVKNQNLGFEVPYRYGSETRIYIPDYIVLIDDGHGMEDLLHLIVEIKGYRREDAKDKKNTMEAYWLPGVNNCGIYGRWAFSEFTDVYLMESDFSMRIGTVFDDMISSVIQKTNT